MFLKISHKTFCHHLFVFFFFVAKDTSKRVVFNYISSTKRENVESVIRAKAVGTRARYKIILTYKMGFLKKKDLLAIFPCRILDTKLMAKKWGTF